MSGDYKVGYRRPPAQHRFQKGASGNPKGRPRKDQTSSAPSSSHAEVDDILLKEALRPITVRENDKVLVMPMIQAVYRSLGVAAVKGHHRSQIMLANMVKAVQAARYDDRRRLFETAVEYKRDWREAFEEADRRGVPRPEPVPHPDDLVLDMNNMQVRFNGPSSDDEKAEWDAMAERRQAAAEEIKTYRRLAKRPSSDQQFYQDMIRSEQELIEMFDAILPPERIRRRPGFDLQVWRQEQMASGSPAAARLSRAAAGRQRKLAVKGRRAP